MRGDRLPFSSFIVGKMEGIQSVECGPIEVVGCGCDGDGGGGGDDNIPHYVTDESWSSNYGSRFKKSTGKLEVWQFTER